MSAEESQAFVQADSRSMATSWSQAGSQRVLTLCFTRAGASNSTNFSEYSDQWHCNSLDRAQSRIKRKRRKPAGLMRGLAKGAGIRVARFAGSLLTGRCTAVPVAQDSIAHTTDRTSQHAASARTVINR